MLCIVCGRNSFFIFLLKRISIFKLLSQFEQQKTVGELEGIDFEAFFDSDNFIHQETEVINFLKQKSTKTTRMRDTHVVHPPKFGNLIFVLSFGLTINILVIKKCK